MAIPQSNIVMVGPFPPPVHGMATTNAAVWENLRALGIDPVIINTAAPSLGRSLVARLGRLPQVLRGLVRSVGTHRLRCGTIYMSISGGWGQLYEIAFVSVARLRGMRIFLRHCSFAYLDTPSRIARILIKIAGPFAVHVTQSQGMADRLKERYGASRVVPISNAVLYPQSSTSPVRLRRKLETLGFFSNITTEKGIFEFLDLMDRVRAKEFPLKARLAGLFQDSQTERAVRARLQKLPGVEYVGPVYGADKDKFLDSIDVLIFPTRYKNETEAKVNHEAMSRAIPVIGYGRGCIPEILGPDCGLVIDPAAPFVPAALTQLETWLADPAAFEAASQAAARRFAKTYAENTERWVALLADIAGSGRQ